MNVNHTEKIQFIIIVPIIIIIIIGSYEFFTPVLCDGLFFRVWVIASLLKFSGPFVVFWPIFTTLKFGGSLLFLLFPTLPLPLPNFWESLRASFYFPCVLLYLKAHLSELAQKLVNFPIISNVFLWQKNHFQTTKKLKTNTNIYSAKTDKGAGVVNLDHSDNISKMPVILDDVSKFHLMGDLYIWLYSKNGSENPGTVFAFI